MVIGNLMEIRQERGREFIHSEFYYQISRQGEEKERRFTHSEFIIRLNFHHFSLYLQAFNIFLFSSTLISWPFITLILLKSTLFCSTPTYILREPIRKITAFPWIQLNYLVLNLSFKPLPLPTLPTYDHTDPTSFSRPN